MSKTFISPQNYKQILNLIETEKAIKKLKDYFEMCLSESLNLIKVSAPLLVKEGLGINDNLNGTERIVSFDALDFEDGKLEVVQSLAKWKRVAISRYSCKVGEGLYTNMNAIRRDEQLDHLHSFYVDQWDWEKVIAGNQRNKETLKQEVRKIYRAIKQTELYIHGLYPELQPTLPNELIFITAQELEEQYPDLTPKERENEIAKENGAVFIMEIGGALLSGEKHDGRSPDYDDWSLNGDIILWNPILKSAFEISSMGIRVDRKALLNQLRASNCEERKTLKYHQAILNQKLPFTIGGGIGQSRLCMFLLKKAHIGEVQASVWSDDIINNCKDRNIELL